MSWELGIHGIVLVLWLAWWLGTAEREHRGERVLSLLLVLGVGLAVRLLVNPYTLDLSWLNPIREGSTDIQVRVARAEGVSGSAMYTRALMPLWVGEQRGLDVLVVVNLALAAMATAGVGLIGRRITQSWWVPLLILMAWVPSRAWSAAALSSEPSSAIWVLGLMAGLALWEVWRAERVAPPSVVVVAVTVLMATYRLEPAAVLAGALALAWFDRAGLSERLGTGIRARPWTCVGALAAIFVASLAAYPAFRDLVGGAGRMGWVLQALFPLDSSLWTLPLILASMLSPVLVLMALVGGLSAPSRTLGLALPWWLVLRVEHAAAHGGMLGTGDWAWPMEMLRYVSYGGIVVPLLACWGWVRLSELGDGRGRVWATVLFGAAVAVPAVPSLWLPRFEDATFDADWQPYAWQPMALDNQHEARAILHAMRARPDCGFVAPGDVRGDGTRTWFAWRSTWGHTRRNERRMVTLSQVRSMSDLADAVPGQPDCVLLYTGLACALAPGSCDDATQGLDRWYDEVFEPAPQTHPDHGWTTTEPWRATWWQLRSDDL